MKPSPWHAVLALAFLFATVAPLRAAEEENTTISAQSLDSQEKDGVVTTVLDGNVEVTGTNIRVTCDHLEVISLRSGIQDDALTGNQNRFKSLVATGHVKIVQVDSKREATCGRAEILPGEERILLTENPMVVDRDDAGNAEVTWIGDELELLRGEGKVRGKNIKIIGAPLKDLGFDPTKIAPAPETPAPSAQP